MVAALNVRLPTAMHFVMLVRMRIHLPLLAVGSVLALLLGACASHPPAPVIDLSGGQASGTSASTAQTTLSETSGRYRVQVGDSLYSIAFRNQLDWKQLARWNGIAAPFTIYPGMSLRLDRPAKLPARSPQQLVVQPVVASTPDLGTRAPVVDLPTPSGAGTPAEVAPAATTATVAAATPVVASTPESSPPTANPITAPSASKPVSAPSAVRQAGGLRWSWPNSGPLIGSFLAGDPTRHGIDIGGTKGEPVLATADGVVVYSGNGLVGYGELVIIKHSDAFLSAYGHNSKRLVQEGQHVRRGEKIAEMGSSGTSRTELHFEIRRQGDPVDPLAFLPHR